MKSVHAKLQQENKTLQFDLECNVRSCIFENLHLRSKLGRNCSLIQALETALRNVKTDNERQRAELV